MRQPLPSPEVAAAIEAALAEAAWITRTADRRRLASRLSQERGYARRAAAVCLARPAFDGHAKELRLALSGCDGWTAPELAAFFTVLGERGLCFRDEEWLVLALEPAAGLDDKGRATVGEHLWPVIDAVCEGGIDAGARPRLYRLIGRVFRTGPEAMPLAALVPGDEWATALRDRLGDAPPEGLVRLVHHLTELDKPRPTQRWRVRCRELLRADGAGDLVRAAMRAFGEDTEVRRHWGTVRSIVSDANADVARGFVWAVVLLEADDAVAVLSELVPRAAGVRRGMREDLKLAGAAINALGDCADPAAVGALWRLRELIRHRALRKQIDIALGAAARRSGITPGQLLERSIPDHGLAPDGTLTRAIGDWTAVLSVEDAMTVRLGFRSPDGATVRTVPAALKESDDLAALKAVRKEIRQTLSAERARLESLFTADRAWPYEEWARHYRDHPITGAVTRGLIWRSGGRGVLPEEVVPGSEVRLWHPARASLEEIAAWRGTVTARRLRQPFKQAYREVYLLTPAEEQARVHSDRFAAHIVDHPRLYALLRQRQWRTTWLGAFYDGHATEAKKELAEGAWQVGFRYESAHVEGGEVTLAATGRIRFARRQGRGFAQAELAEVPPLVFSEAMRDADLFVALTSIAADPDWRDRGEDDHRTYWRHTSTGPLPPSAEVRHDALARLIPRTSIADRLTLADRFLVVQGDLRMYKIHLGSANVLMDPDDAYLCLVPARKRDSRLFLPFEEDGQLSLILSKAFLLAADSKITDEHILRQIEGTRRNGE
ncbi:DUF4132 domain-containing protein [Nonomuraea spiralis]|uniref:DUF4132 domain-containing protein n=1 Tax=Nonomuraea spiralis TaxID=46182 RepID=A0ABV5IV48_9ACTN|nr:DUF4132 domain-containing protein [Nonomuraea spiralis]